jgi:hypothetical protein
MLGKHMSCPSFWKLNFPTKHNPTGISRPTPMNGEHQLLVAE